MNALVEDPPRGKMQKLAAWLRATFGKGKPLSSAEAVGELAEESRAIIDYLRISGGLNDDRLMQALIAVEALSKESRTLGDKAVIDLQIELNKARATIPFSTISALRSGWRPDKDRLREKAKNIFFVALALALMFAVAHLTQIYGRGTTLLADLQKLEDSDPVLQFGRLERRILLSSERYLMPLDVDADGDATGTPPEGGTSEPGETAGSPPANGNGGDRRRPAEYTEATLLAHEALFQYVTDLINLDREIRLLDQRAELFMQEAAHPFAPICDWYVIGIVCMSEAEAEAERIAEIILAKKAEEKAARQAKVEEAARQAKGEDAAKQTKATGAADHADEPTEPAEPDLTPYAQSEQKSDLSRMSLGRFCRSLPYIAAQRDEAARSALQKSADFRTDEYAYFASMNYLFYEKFGIDSAAIVKQNCELNMNYYSAFLPFVQSLVASVSFHTSTYSFIVLPCLYGALGAFVFFMKRVLDPLHPNPPLHRMAFRVALGALAGMSLAWLWEGVFKSTGELEAVGFGLFTLAFIFGFAIDVFFTLLNHLVTIANNAVARIGAAPGSDAQGVG